MTYKQAIIDYIEKLEDCQVFISNDFLHIADYETVRSTLNRLVKENVIRRIMKGFYYKPTYVEMLEDYDNPAVNDLVAAIARKYNWTIAPSENTALNMFGLSTQVPMKYVYISSGRSVKFKYHDITIEFKHRSIGEMFGMYKISAAAIQAIKAIGKDRVTDKHITILKKALSEEHKNELLEKAQTTSVWVYQVVKQICDSKNV